MVHGQILGSVLIPHGRGKARMYFLGGLHKIGEQKPYFTLTADVRYPASFKGHMVAVGCMHEEILKYRPSLSDLAALHLSDEEGIPMYAEANGWYWLVGALGGLGEQYHGGSGEGRREDGTYGKYTDQDCMAIFARHCRITPAEGWELAKRISTAEVTNANGQRIRLTLSPEYRESIRALWAQECEAMKPRWKAEAEACKAKHSLRVFED